MALKQDGARRTCAARPLPALGVRDHDHRALSRCQISRRANLPMATTHRVLADLTGARLLVRRSDGAYEIGARLRHLGLLSAATTLRETALPHLQDLAAATGHTVHLAVTTTAREARLAWATRSVQDAVPVDEVIGAVSVVAPLSSPRLARSLLCGPRPRRSRPICSATAPRTSGRTRHRPDRHRTGDLLDA